MIQFISRAIIKRVTESESVLSDDKLKHGFWLAYSPSMNDLYLFSLSKFTYFVPSKLVCSGLTSVPSTMLLLCFLSDLVT